MKIVFVALVLIAATVTANASGIGNYRNTDHGLNNAPVCPDGQVAEFIGVINGHAAWRCVPA